MVERASTLKTTIRVFVRKDTKGKAVKLVIIQFTFVTYDRFEKIANQSITEADKLV